MPCEANPWMRVGISHASRLLPFTDFEALSPEVDISRSEADQDRAESSPKGEIHGSFPGRRRRLFPAPHRCIPAVAVACRAKSQPTQRARRAARRRAFELAARSARSERQEPRREK